LLTEGNERFVAGRTVNGDPRAQVRATESGQAPFASRSEVIRTLVARRELRVVAAMHDVGTGRVTFLG
jgi:hypothetical protein